MELSERQETVLRALVTAYVGEGAPVGSHTLSHMLPVPLSSASVRNTMAELMELGMIEQPHTSSGRMPTESGLRHFVDVLMAPRDPGVWERRRIELELSGARADTSLQLTSQLLSDRTRQLGFVVLPRLDRVVLRHLSLIRLSSERVLAVLVAKSGAAYQRVFEDTDSGDQPQLDAIASVLNERIPDRTLHELRAVVEAEAHELRFRAGLLRAVRLLAEEVAHAGDFVVAGRLALLTQPEFHDPERLRELLEALDARESLLAVLDRVLEQQSGVAVIFGGEVAEPALRRCAVVSAPCGPGAEPLGMVGVLGPSRMDYGRVVPLVDLFARLLTEKLAA